MIKKALLIVLLGGLFLPELLSSSALCAVISENEQRSIAASQIQTRIKLDGILSEPSWKNANSATDFIQRELNEGAPATEKTEVKILYDNDNLYIGVMCYDSEPEKIIHNELRVDGRLYSDDNFSIILDTYNDKRGGFYFCTNPNGARQDGKIKPNGRGYRAVNYDWNGIWDVSAKITEYGWSGEIVIPFKTLRFQRVEIQEWGINFRREIARKNEEVLWCSWRRNDGLFQLTKSGRLYGLDGINRGKKVEFKPYTLGGFEKEEGTRNNKFKYGLDIKCPLTSDLTLDLTTFTDFAQIEADRTIINLTRFDIRYPEKRDFFLEGAEIFEFASPYTSPFYSRKIGITNDEDRELMTILGGAKLTGKAGDYHIGIINMQTDKENSYPSTNYSVVRVKKDILEKSYIGFIATNLYDSDKHKNQALGIDFSYNTDKFLNNKNFSIGGYVAENKTPGVNHGTRAGRLLIQYPNDLIDIEFLHHVVGENYDPEIGFVRRGGIKQYMFDFDVRPRPGIPYIRQLWFNPIDLNVYTDMDGKLLTRSLRFTPFGLFTTTDDNFRINIYNSYECLDEDFNIFNDVVIPKDDYTWWNYETTLRSNSSRPVSFDFEYQWGDFYNGERTSLETGLNYKLNRYFAFSTDMTYNDISIGSEIFNTKEYRLRLNVNFSTRLTSRSYIQWNNEDKITNLNFRIHFIPKIGSDFYFVYNHLWDGYQNYNTIFNTAISKIAYQISF